ncbi:MAG: DMT family transporter, partial [Candidatus Latescibacteria bacterium]|nr:DMT family transporter [Candidatus Latescibacterota bacterium]
HQAVYSFTPQITAAVLYQGLVIAGFCFIVATSLLRRYRASRLGVFGFITPVFGVLLSNLLLGEGVSAGLLVSVVLVGAGIAIVNSEA